MQNYNRREDWVSKECVEIGQHDNMLTNIVCIILLLIFNLPEFFNYQRTWNKTMNWATALKKKI